MKKRTQKLLALATVLTMGAGVLASCRKSYTDMPFRR